jgi:hypothetical protein
MQASSICCISPALILFACASGTAEPPAKAPVADAPAAPLKDDTVKATAPDPQQQKAIPTECGSQGDDLCHMPKEFVSRLCQDVYPNMALFLFAKGTPWTRGYLTRKTQAWNAEGGASVEGFVEFDEEVLLLSSKAPPKGGMQVSGMGGYQALRWDGSCVSLESEEVTLKRPPSVKHPRIDWRYIDDPIREALRKDSAVDQAYLAQRKECKGVSVGDVSKKCVDTDQKLGDAIVKSVEETGGIPEPEKKP